MNALIEQSDTIEVILKVTERCNINCTYCYMFNKGNEDWATRPAAIGREWMDGVIAFLREGIERLGVKRTNIIFHGGEPLMLKKSKFRELCGALRDSLGHLVELELGVQTNAILIDSDWIDIFSEFDISLGISLDGPAHINDLHRVDKKGRGTYAGTMRGMGLLQEAYNAGRICKPGVIVVINPENDSREIYRHVVDELGITNVSFNLPMETNDTIRGADRDKYARYLLDLFDEWVGDDNPNIKIRIFDQMFRFFTGDVEFQALLRNFLTKHVMVVIASDGTLSEHDDFKVINFAQRGGTIRDTSLYEFANSPLRRYLDTVARTTPDECRSCGWKNYCRAGVSHGLTISRYGQTNGFNNRSSMCGAFASLFDAGAQYLLKNGLPADRLRAALETVEADEARSTSALSIVPQDLFSPEALHIQAA
jgi:uncharacterized protein